MVQGTRPWLSDTHQYCTSRVSRCVGLTLRCSRPATAGFASLRRRLSSNVRPRLAKRAASHLPIAEAVLQRLPRVPRRGSNGRQRSLVVHSRRTGTHRKQSQVLHLPCWLSPGHRARLLCFWSVQRRRFAPACCAAQSVIGANSHGESRKSTASCYAGQNPCGQSLQVHRPNAQA